MQADRNGSREATKHGSRGGIDLFIEEGAYTSLAAAVSILVTLSLLFAVASGIWSMSRSGDVQVSADATALAGANVVSSYHTTATVLDAAVLSMGLAGICVTGVGLVGLLIPGVNALAPQTIDAGIRMLDARNDFAASASRGLQTLESSLPFLVAANGTRTCSAQSGEATTYTGTALAVPTASASEFPALEGNEVAIDELEATSDELEVAADELAEAQEETARAKEAAWLADCGRDGRNMQERAGSLSGISAAENPDYASSLTWDPNVALDRTRAYYAWRYAHEAPEGSGVEAAADSAARKAFYAYASEQFASAAVIETETGVTISVPLLPKNTDEARNTTLYTDAAWPTTQESRGRTLHYSLECPGATGASAGMGSFADVEAGRIKECPTCAFGIGDVGRVPAASTSIDNGYEYHLREFTLALEDYAACRGREIELEREARGASEDAADAFDAALETLAAHRPHIAPPGRYGVVAVVVSSATETPEELSTPFAAQPEGEVRGAISAAVLAPDEATDESNVLASFFSSLASRTGGGGAVGLIDDVMGLWGKLLIAYGDVAEGLSQLMDDLLGGLSMFGLGPLATWMGDRIDGAVSALGFEPVDLSSMKPVLTDSANVLAHADVPGLSDAQELLRSLPVGSTDPAALLEALEYDVGERLLDTTITIAEIPLPGGVTIPLTVRVGDVVGIVGGGG